MNYIFQSFARTSPLRAKAFPIVMVFAAIMSFSIPAKANVAYTFIKVTCDKNSGTASIQAFWDWDKSGQKRVDTPEKGTYFVDDIIDHDAIKVCDLEAGQTIAFMASHNTDAQAASDTIRLVLNGKTVREDFSLVKQWTLKIRALGENRFNVEDCSDEPEATGKPSDNCTIFYVHDGGRVSTFLRHKDDN